MSLRYSGVGLVSHGSVLTLLCRPAVQGESGGSHFSDRLQVGGVDHDSLCGTDIESM